MVCELQTEAGANFILDDALNVFGISHYARANFVLNQSSGATELNNMFFYNTQKVTLKTQTEVATDLRDIGKYTVFFMIQTSLLIMIPLGLIFMMLI